MMNDEWLQALPKVDLSDSFFITTSSCIRMKWTAPIPFRGIADSVCITQERNRRSLLCIFRFHSQRCIFILFLYMYACNWKRLLLMDHVYICRGPYRGFDP